jgi:hypothetical protein
MSRYYACSVFTHEKISEKELEILDEYNDNTTLHGGKTEDEYAEEIVKEIWDRFGRYVPLTVAMTYLEDLPYEEYEFGSKEYNMYSREKEKKKKEP